jgi:hypothetical protein
MANKVVDNGVSLSNNFFIPLDGKWKQALEEVGKTTQDIIRKDYNNCTFVSIFKALEELGIDIIKLLNKGNKNCKKQFLNLISNGNFKDIRQVWNLLCDFDPKLREWNFFQVSIENKKLTFCYPISYNHQNLKFAKSLAVCYKPGHYMQIKNFDLSEFVPHNNCFKYSPSSRNYEDDNELCLKYQKIMENLEKVKRKIQLTEQSIKGGQLQREEERRREQLIKDRELAKQWQREEERRRREQLQREEERRRREQFLESERFARQLQREEEEREKKRKQFLESERFARQLQREEERRREQLIKDRELAKQLQKQLQTQSN